MVIKMKMNRKFFASLMILCLVMNFMFSGESEAAKKRRTKRTTTSQTSGSDSVLPKRGDIALIVEGDDEQHVKITEAKIIDSLVRHGYRVVDEAKMKKMKAAAVRAQAFRLAMQGNFNAIFKLNASYSCAATIIARVQAGKPEKNQFNLYTGNANISITAITSRGTKLGGKTATSTQVAFTEYETQVKAIEAAVENGMKQMY